MTAYYNEIDPYAAEWLRNLIAAGHIAPGDKSLMPIQVSFAQQAMGAEVAA